MAKKQRNNSYNTGIAAEYFILSQLYRKNIEAYISQGNKKAIDIRIIKNNGTTISVDVKAVRGFASLIVNNITAKKDHYIIFVTYNNKIDQLDVLPEVFIVPSLKVINLISTFKDQKRIMKTPILPYKDKWECLVG